MEVVSSPVAVVEGVYVKESIVMCDLSRLNTVREVRVSQVMEFDREVSADDVD